MAAVKAAKTLEELEAALTKVRQAAKLQQGAKSGARAIGTNWESLPKSTAWKPSTRWCT